MSDEKLATLEPGEADLMGQLAQFAARKLTADSQSNGVYLNKMYSRSLGAPVLLVVALGEQALALEQLLMKSAISESSLIDTIAASSGGKAFLKEN